MKYLSFMGMKMLPQYSIKINFDDRLLERPERVFEAMGLYVKGFNGLQAAFIKGFDNNISIQSGLCKTREGSLIADIGHKIVDKSKQLSISSIWDNIFCGLEDAISTVGKIDSEGDVKRFTEKVYAKVPANDDVICPCDANQYEIAKNLKLIFEGVHKLAPTDYTEFGASKQLQKISQNFNFPRSPEELFEDKSAFYSCKDLLIIKRPDYVGNSQWEFLSAKRKMKPVRAKVLHEDWLSKWRNHRVQFWPGDALLVQLVTKRVSGGKDNSIIYKDEIIEVIDIISQDKIEQTTLDFSNE